MAKSQEITYESPSLNRKKNGSIAPSISVSRETSFSSLEISSLPSGPVSLRIKAVLNRSYSNFEGAQSQAFRLNVSHLEVPRARYELDLHAYPSELRRCATSPDGCSQLGLPSPASKKRGSLPDVTNSLRSSTYRSWSSLKPGLTRHLNSIRQKWNNSITRRGQTEERRQWKESEHFAKVLGVVVFIFYLSWFPLAISITLTLVVGMTPAILNMTYISMNMTLGGPLLIPIAYGVLAKSYRHGYRNALRCIFCCACIITHKHRSRKVDINNSSVQR